MYGSYIMAAVVTILIFGGWLASAVGGIMILVAAFRETSGQGLLNLLVPFYAIYFAATRWDECKTGALISIAGIAAVILGGVLGAGAALAA